MKTLLSLPSWLLIRALLPFFPRTHPWHAHRVTLRWWRMGATDDTLYFGATMWLSLAFWAWAYFIIHPL